MAIGKASDFTIYEAEFNGGQVEGLASNIDAFNAASRNSIILESPMVDRGQYHKTSFFKQGTWVSRRDLTSVTAATDIALTQGELIGVKVSRKFGPIAQTIDAWRKIAKDPREMSFILGQQYAQHKQQAMLDSALLAAEAAIQGQSALNYDATGQSTKTLTHGHLVSGLAKFGDRQNAVRCWVMHSKPYFNLMSQAITDKVYEVAGVTINSGTVASLGRPIVVTDLASTSGGLYDLNGSLTDTYNVLGLVEGGVRARESEREDVAFELVTGLENLVYRFQAEFSYTIFIAGMKWDVGNGGANPTDANLATTTNWDAAVTSDKDKAGIRVVVQ